MDYLRKQYNQAKNDKRRREERPAPAPTRPAPSDTARAHTPRPPPTPATAFDKLQAITSELHQLVDSFEPPSTAVQLEWQPNASIENPKLAFNSTNAPVHAYEDALMKLIIKLDGIESDGDSSIRDQRKRLVKRVEGELARLDEWKSTRVKQSRGERIDGDGSELAEHAETHPASDESGRRFDESPPPEYALRQQADDDSAVSSISRNRGRDDERDTDERRDEQSRVRDRSSYAQYQGQAQSHHQQRQQQPPSGREQYYPQQDRQDTRERARHQQRHWRGGQEDDRWARRDSRLDSRRDRRDLETRSFGSAADSRRDDPYTRRGDGFTYYRYT